MKKIDIFDFFADDFRYSFRHALLQSILFILLGILIFVFPQVLIGLISAFFILIGIIFLVSAFTFRRFIKYYNKVREDLFDIL